MAGKVTAMDVRMATALAGAVPNVSAFCAEQDISRQTFYKWRRRFAAGGVEGLSERSRRPARSPGATAAGVEESIVRWRKKLADDGADHGPDSIRWQLLRAGGHAPVPGRTTIWRVLVRRGLVTPAPAKRPKSSLHRFVYARPNDCWQSDWTGWQLADGAAMAIAGTLDDHSRYLAGLRAAPGDGTAELVWATMTEAISECGVPARSLTDNGLVYSGLRRGISVPFETNLRALGTHVIASSPHHPGTCGKIERLWQTLKRWLDAQDPADTEQELNAQLDTFRGYYNHDRPHRALKGAIPAEAFAATVKARPAAYPLPNPVSVLTSRVTPTGVVSAGPYDVNVGNRWAGHQVDVIRDGEHIAIFSANRLVRELTADPARRYQTNGQPRYDLRGTREQVPDLTP